MTDPSGAVTNYRTHFLSYLGIASKAPNILLQIANMLVGAEKANLSRRISVTLVVQIAVFLFIIGLAAVDTSSMPDAFFWATMGAAATINLANGVYQGKVFCEYILNFLMYLKNLRLHLRACRPLSDGVHKRRYDGNERQRNACFPSYDRLNCRLP